MKLMDKINNITSTKAQRIARVASEFERERTGHPPQSVSVVMSGDTLVITLHGSLSAGEKALAQSPEGAARVLELHRQLFASSSMKLQEQIKAITGVEVRESKAEVETTTGAIVQVFTHRHVRAGVSFDRKCADGQLGRPQSRKPAAQDCDRLNTSTE